MNDKQLQDITELDEQILELLDKRKRLWSEAESGNYELSADDRRQIISHWMEVAADYELDDELTEKAVKILNALCKKSED